MTGTGTKLFKGINHSLEIRQRRRLWYAMCATSLRMGHASLLLHVASQKGLQAQGTWDLQGSPAEAAASSPASAAAAMPACSSCSRSARYRPAWRQHSVTSLAKRRHAWYAFPANPHRYASTQPTARIACTFLCRAQAYGCCIVYINRELLLLRHHACAHKAS